MTDESMAGLSQEPAPASRAGWSQAPPPASRAGRAGPVDDALSFSASRADGAGDERDHDEERPESGDLGDVAQRVSGDGLHLTLLGLYKFMICSLIVRVNSLDPQVL